jgi:hypothetical protein
VPIGSNRQFWNLIAYIHQNPQKHRFIQDVRKWKFSSYETILVGESDMINCGEVMKWFGTREEYLSLHKEWVSDARAKWFMGNDFD